MAREGKMAGAERPDAEPAAASDDPEIRQERMWRAATEAWDAEGAVVAQPDETEPPRSGLFGRLFGRTAHADEPAAPPAYEEDAPLTDWEPEGEAAAGEAGDGEAGDDAEGDAGSAATGGIVLLPFATRPCRLAVVYRGLLAPLQAQRRQWIEDRLGEAE